MTDKNEKKANPQQSRAAEQREGVGPTDIEGVWAGDLENEGRGGPETNAAQQLGRKLPQQTGGVIGVDGERTRGESGIRGNPNASDADKHAGGGAGGVTKSI